MRAVATAAVVVLLTGCAVRQQYEEQQLGRRTWQMRAGDWWAKSIPDLERRLMARAAERTREMGFRYFVVRDFSGDLSRYRSFMVDARAAARPERANVVTGLLTGLDRIDAFLKTPYSELKVQWAHLKFRMLADAEIDQHVDVLDARKLLGE